MFEVESDTLNEAIECTTFHKHVPKFGERAWMAEGKEVNVIYWDTGNTWCIILDVYPKKETENPIKVVEKFYKKLRRVMEKYYTENII